MTKHHGSCLCGGVRYTIGSELSDFGYCHCRSCQKASGSAHAANAGVSREHLEIDDAKGLLREFESSPGKRRVFCSRCGSPILTYLEATPHLVRIRLGTLDSELDKTAKAHTWVSEKASWERIEGDLPQFAEWADRSVLEQTGSKQPREEEDPTRRGEPA